MRDLIIRGAFPALVGLLILVGVLSLRVVLLRREVEEARVLQSLDTERRGARERLDTILDDWEDQLVRTRGDLLDRLMEWRELEAPLCVEAE